MPEKVNFRGFLVEARDELVFERINWVCMNRSIRMGEIPTSGSVGIKHIIFKSVTVGWNFDLLTILGHWMVSFGWVEWRGTSDLIPYFSSVKGDNI